MKSVYIEPEYSFPLLARCSGSLGDFVVLFTDKSTGTVVSASKTSPRYIGDHETNFSLLVNPDIWEVLLPSEPVTLSNDMFNNEDGR